jgi:PTS system mannitol-specific IIC component
VGGGAAGVLTFMVTGAGLVATPSPGSIFAYMAVTPKGGYFGVLLGIVISAGVSFIVNAVLLGFGRLESDREAVLAPDSDIVAPPAHVVQLPAQGAPAHRTASSEA